LLVLLFHVIGGLLATKDQKLSKRLQKCLRTSLMVPITVGHVCLATSKSNTSSSSR